MVCVSTIASRRCGRRACLKPDFRISRATDKLSACGGTVMSAHERTAVRVPGPSSRQPRYHRTVPQGKSGHVNACKRWAPERGAARMTSDDQ